MTFLDKLIMEVIILKQKDYIKITGVIFAIIAVLHGWRLLSGWQVTMGTYAIPVWASVVGLVIAGYLAYSAWNLKK